MLISLDKERCIKCGKCIEIMQGLCISESDGYPVFDDAQCNTCQKCVAVCPAQAIMVNGKYPDRIDENYEEIEPEQIYSLFEKRRSIKHYQNKSIPGDIVKKIVSVAKYAPNQNKNISVHVIDDKKLIEDIDKAAIKYVRKMDKILFGFKPITSFIKLFYKDINVMKRKMEYNSFKRVLKENTQVILIVTGNKHVPVTKSSAHYLMATMMYMAEALGVGTCLMDSVYRTLTANRKLREKIGIEEDVLGALTLGYSNENIINIPRGYEVDIKWNKGGNNK